MTRKLILHAGDPGHAPPDSAQLARALQDLGLVEGPVPGQAHAWYAGDRFLSLVIFLGCSPRVAFQPATDEQAEEGGYCHVRYRTEGDDPVFRAAPGPLRPRCPACRKPFTPDPGLFREGADGTARQQCPSCGQTHGAMELDWRQGAGCGRWFLEIWSVHPHEAVPADDLITALERTAATPVRYFYE
jgi:hypothetical protein